MSLILNEWEGLTPARKRPLIIRAVSRPLPGRHYSMKPWILDNVWAIDLFVKEIIAARDSGKQHYSAQRIYDFLAHRGQTKADHLRFIEHNCAAQVLAAIVTSIFSLELTGFFNEQGVVA